MKKKYFIKIKVFNSVFLMEIDVYSVSHSWNIDYEGLNLASIYGRKVENCEKMIRKIEIYIEKELRLDERLKKLLPSFSEDLFLTESFLDKWEPDITSCSVSARNVREAVNSFFKKPENMERLSVAKTSQKFGI